MYTDHFPWLDCMLLTSNPYAPGSTPARPAPAPAAPARTFHKHGSYMICSACQLAAEYCACARQPVELEQAPSAEAGSSMASLAQRIKDTLS